MKPWKLQKFGGDLMYDLRSRGLLPIALLLIIAIVAAPFVISSMSSSEPADSFPAATGQLKSASELAPENQTAVLAYTPGVRNYRERLDRQSKDPFVQQFANPGKAAETALEGEGGGGGEADSGTGGTGGGGGGGGGGGEGGGGGGGKEKKFHIYFEIDLLTGVTGQTLTRRNSVPEFTVLPSQEAPTAVFLGASENGQQAIFSVSREVTSVSGEGICYPEPTSCELLGLARGQGADLLYQGTSYRIEVANIRRIKSTKPPP